MPGALHQICANLSSFGGVSVHLEDVVQSSKPGVNGTPCAVVVPLVTEKKPCCFLHRLTGALELVVPGLAALSLRWMNSPAPPLGTSLCHVWHN